MKNEYKVTKDLFMSWAKENNFHSAANIVLFVLWCIVGLIGLGLIVLYSFIGADFIDWYLSVLFLLLSVFKLFFSRFVSWSNRYKLLSKTYGVSEWIRTIEFTDEEIILSDHTSTSRLKYENIKKIEEKNNIINVFFNNNLCLRLYKDAFVEGSWEECKAKINSKMK